MKKESESAVEGLKQAFAEDNAALVARLLQADPQLQAQINAPIAAFDAPLMIHVRSRAMLDVLVDAGADLNAKSHWWAGGFGLLHGAPLDVAQYAITRGAVVDIHAAARLGLMAKVRTLVSGNPSLVHARGGDGQTPLHFASTVAVAEYLLDRGADIDALDVDHESTPAQYMVRDRQEVARCLVRRGCKADLLMAAALGDIALVREHLDADPACIRLSVSDQCFPKTNPRSGGSIYIWTLGQHKTAHALAREFGHEEIVQLLMERSPEDLKLIQACALGDEPAVKALLSRQPDLMARLSEEARGNLVHAAQNNHLEGVRLMLSVGWPSNARGQHGGTALHWAAWHGNAAMTELILRSNPPLEWTDANFQATPLGWALHGSEHGWDAQTGDYARTVEALLRAGAKLPTKRQGSAAVIEVIDRFRQGRL